MFSKPVEKITKQDIEDLVSNEVPEGKTIEYKERLPRKSDGDKKDFLASISSFANANGGFLIYGMKCGEDENGKTNGIANEAVGLEGINTDEELLRLNQVIEFGLSPKIQGLHIKSISGFPNGPVIVIQIPQSWSRPHQITYQSWSRFYTRNSNGNSLMDITEIRGAFLQSQTLYRRIEEFRKKRIELIKSGQNPLTKNGKTETVISHLIPLGFEDPASRVDLATNKQFLDQLLLFHKGFREDKRFNFDGYSSIATDINGEPLSYIQFYRSGIIETASNYLIKPRQEGKIFGGYEIEKAFIKTLKNHLDVINSINLKGPFIFLASFLWVNEFSLIAGRHWNYAGKPIDKGDLLFPDILIEDTKASPDHLLRPVFDMLYQACGYEKCTHYDENGNWVEQN